MVTRCKFTCVEVTKLQAWGTKDPDKRFVYRAKFTPVHAGSPENERFYSLTPGGSIELSTYKDDLFVPGEAYYIDFSPAVDPSPV
jgi:hypothetical protein